MRNFGIAGLQLELSRGDNFAVIAAEVRKAKARLPWLSLVMFGELATFGADLAKASAMPGDVESAYASLARETGLWLVPGSLYEKSPKGIFNTAPVIDPGGSVVARCRKMFPFLPYERGVAPGTEPCVFDVPGVGRLGVSICYDMWFPETTRQLAHMGVEAVLHPTMTNTIDRDVEIAIARANAATNQLYFFDVNVAGPLGFGRSVVCGPGGEVLHQAGVGHEVMAFDIDLDQVKRVRERGWNGLGQTLKSFRDAPAQFPVYAADDRKRGAMGALGPLQMPGQDGAITDTGASPRLVKN